MSSHSQQLCIFPQRNKSVRPLECPSQTTATYQHFLSCQNGGVISFDAADRPQAATCHVISYNDTPTTTEHTTHPATLTKNRPGHPWLSHIGQHDTSRSTTQREWPPSQSKHRYTKIEGIDRIATVSRSHTTAFPCLAWPTTAILSTNTPMPSGAHCLRMTDGLYTSRSPKGRPFAEASQWPPLCRSSQQCERKLGMATPISRGKEG